MKSYDTWDVLKKERKRKEPGKNETEVTIRGMHDERTEEEEREERERRDSSGENK